jgi:hypothetical protein
MNQELAGVTEVATTLSVSKQRVTQLAESPGFPPPVAELASGRIWDLRAIRLWAQANPTRRNGRPRRGYRIEFEEYATRRRGPFTVILNVCDAGDPEVASTFQREYDNNVGGWVRSRLGEELPDEQSDLSFWRAMVGLASRQLAREIEDADQNLDLVARVAPMEQRWTQYLLTFASSIRHPIPSLRRGEVLHLWLNPEADGAPTEPLEDYVHMECGHWIERGRVGQEAELFATKAECPTCGRIKRVVGFWPQR